jgi:hypothetical protein
MGLEILQWVREQDPPCPWGVSTCNAAADAEDLEVLMWLREQDPPCPWDERTCQAAAGAIGGGSLKMLKWMREQHPPCPWNNATLRIAAEEENLDVLKWARKHGCPKK